jgi:hypothetical protein
MREPLLGHGAGDREQIVAMLERQVRTVTVVIVTAEPLGKETGLRLTLVGEITVEERPQHGVCADPVVKPADKCFERSMASDAQEEIAAGEGMMRLRVGEESTVLHCALVTGGVAIGKSGTFSLRIVNGRGGGSSSAILAFRTGKQRNQLILASEPRRVLPAKVG